MRAIVIGCGSVGEGLARRLSTQGHTVTVVDRDPGSLDRLGTAFGGRTVAGTGFDRGVLEEAGIGEADAVAAVTGSDEVNAVVARLATRRFRVPRVVARMYDPRQADLYRRLGVLTISPVAWGIGRLSELLTLRDVGTVVSLGSGQVDLVEVEVPALLAGRQTGELEAAGELRVVAVTRGGRTFVPDPPAVFARGDLIHVVVAAGAGARLQALLGG